MLKNLKQMPKKKPTNKPAEVHDELKGFDIKIDSFGQMETNMSINKLNDFLDKNIDDKKLKHTSEEE